MTAKSGGGCYDDVVCFCCRDRVRRVRERSVGPAGKSGRGKKSNYMKHFTQGASAKLITLSDVTCGDFA